MLAQCVRNRWDDCDSVMRKAMPILDGYVDQITKQIANGEEKPKIRSLLSIIRAITEYYAMSNAVAANADKAERLDDGSPTEIGVDYIIEQVEAKPDS